MLKRVLLVSFAIFFVLATVAVVAVEYQKQPNVVVVVDDTHQELQFFELPKRLVVLEPGVALLLQQWQREELVVATTEALRPIFSSAENLGPRAAVAVLQVAATRPDLIIAGAEDLALASALREAGLPVLMVAPERLDHLLVWPEKLGSLLAASQQAAQYTRQLGKQISEFRTAAKEEPGAGRRVLWLTDEQYTVAGSNTLEADMLELVGLANAASAFDGYATLEPAEIVAFAPQVIIAPELLFPVLQAPSQEPLGVTEPPYLIPPLHQPSMVGWDDLFARAEQLLEYLQPPVLPQEE